MKILEEIWKEKLMTLEDCFDEKGNFIDPFYDPYKNNNSHKIHSFLFTNKEQYKNYLKNQNALEKFITNNNFSPFCDAVALYHANIFANHTKGNYSTIYYWR